MSGITPNGSSKAAQFSATLKATQDRFNPAARERLSDRNASDTSKFPVTLASTDVDDDKYARRAALVTGAGGTVPGVGQAIADDRYFEYAKRKQDENQMANFREWIFQNADLSTPENAYYWTNTFPFIKEKMHEEIEREGELQTKIAKIAASGPQSEDDWYTLYCLNQGIIRPFDAPLYKMNTAALPYTGGIFSMFVGGPIAPGSTVARNPIVNYSNPLPGGNPAWTGINGGNYGGIGNTAYNGAVNANMPPVNTAARTEFFRTLGFGN